MTWDPTRTAAEAHDQRNKFIGIYIGVLAVMLAICTLGGGNAASTATQKNILAANAWNFFQAKNMRRHTVRLQIDEFEVRLATETTLSPEARAIITEKIQNYREMDKRLTSDPEKQEGLDELFPKAKALEAGRDFALRQNPYFDYGVALLQIAIVLASVALLSRGFLLLGVSAFLGLCGGLLTFNGFTLAVSVPGMG